MPFFYLLVVAAAAAIALFALQNAELVTIRFLAWKVERAPLAAVILISGAAGGFLTALVAFVQRVKLRARIRHLEARQRVGEPRKSGD